MTKHDKVHIHLLKMWVFSIQIAYYNWWYMCVLILCFFFSLPHVLAKYELIYNLYVPTKCKVTPLISALICAYPEKVKKCQSFITHLWWKQNCDRDCQSPPLEMPGSAVSTHVGEVGCKVASELRRCWNLQDRLKPIHRGVSLCGGVCMCGTWHHGQVWNL